jgi:glucose-1-phosphate cytidylyltransferase
MKLTGMRQLAVYQHHGFWQCMDTPREMDLLNELWRQDKAAWAAWR